jgi:hypothetical protein
VLAMQNRFTAIDLWNYDDATFKGLSKSRSPFSRLTMVRFHRCGLAFVAGFLTAMRPITYASDTLVFENVRFDSQSAQALVTGLQETPAFTSLVSFVFVRCTCLNPPFQEFALQVVQSRDTLTSFHVESCDVEVGEMLIEITKVDGACLQNVVLSKNRGPRQSPTMTRSSRRRYSGLMSVSTTSCRRRSRHS